MKKKNILMCLIGLVGMISLSFVAIVDSHASDMVSAIPLTITCAALFIAGYLKNKSDK